VTLVTGSVDLSGTRTSLAMQAAEALGLPLDRVHASVGDTDSVGYTSGSVGSRTTVATGIAVARAVDEIIAKLSARAALLWRVPPDAVSFEPKGGREGGTFRAVDASGEPRQITFEALAARLSGTGGPVSAAGCVDVSEWGTAFGTHIADVEVDPETGHVMLLRYTVIQDVGRAIHPTFVEGQMQGGAVQGIGWGLYEGYAYNAEGQLENPTFLDYKLPTALDVPSIETVIVEVPHSAHPFGVRGVGEMPIILPQAAIANAIYHAVGVRLDELPMTPERILRAMGVIEQV
jgi:CO/xanthine dehydrogenase Mo-binding subunit